MLVVEVDMVGPEPLEGRVAGPADVGGVPADRAGPVVASDDGELRREHDLIAPARDRLADEPLVRAHPVDVSRVQKGDSELERPVDGLERLALVAAAVELGHSHASEPELRDDEALGSELSLLHLSPSVASRGRLPTLRTVGTSRTAQPPTADQVNLAVTRVPWSGLSSAGEPAVGRETRKTYVLRAPAESRPSARDRNVASGPE